MKKMTLPVAVFIAILGCVLAVSANVTTMQMHDKLRQEQFYRIKAESQLQKAVRDVEALRQQMGHTSEALNSIQAILDKSGTERKDLQSQLEQANQEKAVLMQKIEQMKPQVPPESPAVSPTR